MNLFATGERGNMIQLQSFFGLYIANVGNDNISTLSESFKVFQVVQMVRTFGRVFESPLGSKIY